MSKKISQLPAGSSLTGTELIEVVQSGTNKKTTSQDIADLSAGGASFQIFTGIVPHAAGGQAAAVELTGSTSKITYNCIAPSPQNHASLKLPPAQVGMIVYIIGDVADINLGTGNSFDIYASNTQSDDKINGLLNNTAIVLPANFDGFDAVWCICSAANTWLMFGCSPGSLGG